MKQLVRLTFAIIGLLLFVSAHAQDAENGEKLHASKCQTCHDSSVYTRANRFIKSRDALQAQVNRCKKMATADWTAHQIGDVVEYLDKKFYKF